MATRLTSLSRRELDRVVERYPWFTAARRARALATGRTDEALALALLFWPTVAPVAAPEETPATVTPVTAPAVTAEPAAVPKVSANAAPDETPATPDETPHATRSADELIDRFINHGGYRIAPDGEAAAARVDVEIAPGMVSPLLAEIYRAQGLTAEAEKIERILTGK
jgi:hypothetical protein